jgi:hypothetical protein
MIVQGRAVSRDRSGAVFGTTEWRVTTDVTISSAQARPDLFVFTPPQGATIQEEPFVRIEKP